MILVVDASVLITLARIGRLQLLRELADEVVVPDGVFNEVVGRVVGRPGQTEVAQASWISRRHIRDRTVLARLETELGRGESEALVLAKEIGADFLILDDARARQTAERWSPCNRFARSPDACKGARVNNSSKTAH